MSSSQIIEDVRNKSDIVAIISEYVHLQKRGKNFLALCPFHSEKTPSFTVSAEKQLFHCFGCGEGGNVFTFVMKMENIGFGEALTELAAKAGIAIPRSTSAASRGDKDKLYQIMQLAVQFYQQVLNDPSGDLARQYLKSRGITETTKDLFNLGYAPAVWDGLFKYLIARGADPAQIEKSGLILSRENQSGYYDRFRGRLMFPIYDHRGRPVAFGGRSLGNEEPKYLNSPDTLIYHKGEILFGLNLSKESIQKNKTAILVEGNFDLVTPYQAGITNLVATLGTALTTQQCKLLARYCDTVIAAYDADAAGGAAAERSAELFRGSGIKIKIAELKEGKDPDELIRNHGKEAFAKCAAAALPYLEFKIRTTAARHNLNEIEARAAALGEVAAILSRENNAFIQKEYAKLAAKILRADTEAVLAEIKRRSHRGLGGTATMVKPISKIERAEKDIIALTLQNREALAAFKSQLTAEDFSLPDARAVADKILSSDFPEGQDMAHLLIGALPEESKKFLSGLLLGEHLAQADNQGAIISDCIKALKNERLNSRIKALKQRLVEAEKAGKTDEAAEILSALKSEIS